MLGLSAKCWLVFESLIPRWFRVNSRSPLEATHPGSSNSRREPEGSLSRLARGSCPSVTLDKLFFYSAIVGGTLFVVQLVLLFMGAGADVDVDVDADLGGGDTGHAAADASFKVLSLQGITSFVMMFGLVGLAMRTDEGAAPAISLVVALAAGSASTWFIAKIFTFFVRLQSTGTLDMKTAAGATGQVYLTIGRDKPGKVTITVGNRSLTLDAIVETEDVLPTGTPIRVTRVISDTTVAVEKN